VKEIVRWKIKPISLGKIRPINELGKKLIKIYMPYKISKDMMWKNLWDEISNQSARKNNKPINAPIIW